MIIPALIRALLEENLVSVSGLGSFSVKNVPAQIKDDIVFPPQNIIEFDFSEYAEGFNFVSKLSKWEQIRIDEAQAEIAQWIDLLQKGLEHNETVFFDDFGTFSKNLIGKIIFQSVINSKLNIENEGFEPVIISQKNQNKSKREINETVQDKREINIEQKKKKRDFIFFILLIVAATLLLCALFYKDTLKQFYRTTFAKADSAATLAERNDSIAFFFNSTDNADTDILEVENADSEIIASETKATQTPAAEIPASQTTSSQKTNNNYLTYQKGKYYVIAGSFLTESDALRHIKNEKLEKHQAKLIVHPDNPRVRVCIGMFDNESDAMFFADGFKRNYWVLR
jgi:nucleoid DNA-binding protein/uncharacterized protein YpmB